MIKISVCYISILIASTAMFVHQSYAEAYVINRSISNGASVATLVGTLDIPIGSYLIENESESPFTDVDLTMTVDSVSFGLDRSLTDVIFGDGQFFIEATPTSLIFDAIGNNANPADLVFSDNMYSFANNRWAIGSDGSPAFEVANSDNGDVLTNAFSFPVTFGTVVPEPSSMLCLSVLCFAILPNVRRRRLK